MALQDLTDIERSAVRQCLRAIIDGPFIEDWEFHTRLGIHRTTAKTILASWRYLDDSIEDSDTFLAINNSMNEVCHGVPISPDEWEKWFTASREEIRRTFRKWAGLAGMSATGIR